MHASNVSIGVQERVNAVQCPHETYNYSEPQIALTTLMATDDDHSVTRVIRQIWQVRRGHATLTGREVSRLKSLLCFLHARTLARDRTALAQIEARINIGVYNVILHQGFPFPTRGIPPRGKVQDFVEHLSRRLADSDCWNIDLLTDLSVIIPAIV